jgi:hypothetical protein
MTNLRRIVLLLGAISYSTTNAQVVSKFVSIGSEQVCTQVLERISRGNETNATKCTCDGQFTVATGLEVSIACKLNSTVCLGQDVLCGQPSFNGVVSPTGIKDTVACIHFKKDPLVAVDMPDLCVSGQGAGIGKGTTARFESCTATLGTAACNCTICDSGRDFTFDCSTAFEIPTPTNFIPSLPGPKIDKCIGLGLIPHILDNEDVTTNTTNTTTGNE